jgi:hypothetical protein
MSPLSGRPTSVRRVVALLAAAGLALTAVAACGSPSAPPSQQTGASAPVAGDGTEATAILSELGLGGKDATQVIDTLDQTTQERRRDVLASVRYDSVVLKDSTREAALPLPEGRFYLSVAPYLEQTHDCFFHSLTTCTGELAGQPVEVTIIDSTGKALVDGEFTTYANGFVGFWLPRDITGTITVSADGRTATSPISTGPDAPTCLTTLQLL